MRSAVTILMFFCSVLSTNAQTERNAYVAGGGFDLSYTKFDTTYNFSMNIPVTFGYFAVKNLMLGMSLGVGLSADNRAKERKSRLFINTYFIPVIRYYFLKEKTRPFLFAKFGYIGSSSLIRGNNANSDGMTGGGGIGVSHFLSKHLALETSLGYNATKISKNPLRSQIYLSIGLQYYFKYKLPDTEDK